MFPIEKISVYILKRDVGDFSKIALPLIKKIYPKIIVDEIMMADPTTLMTNSTGMVFYMDYVYGTKK